MMKRDLEELNGGRTVVGIDPCSEFLQLAILAPNKETEFKKLPLSPSITEEIVKSTSPETTQIAIESYGSYGKLFIYDLLKKGYDIREVNPHISKKLSSLYSEEHSDQKDAESLAKALLLIPDLPKISITDKKQWLAKLTRTRKKMVKDLNGYLNRLHIALTESYGVVYKSLFKILFAKKAFILHLPHDRKTPRKGLQTVLRTRAHHIDKGISLHGVKALIGTVWPQPKPLLGKLRHLLNEPDTFLHLLLYLFILQGLLIRHTSPQDLCLTPGELP